MYKRELIFSLIDEERKQQDSKFGEANASNKLSDWVCLLVEEVGEVAKEVNDIKHEGKSKDDLRVELIQVAALAVAMLEQLYPYP